jgi:4-oxalocrotonate tautomerase
MSMAVRPPDIGECGDAVSGRCQLRRPPINKDTEMPIVTVQITQEGTAPGRSSASAEEKAAIIKGVSQLLLDVLNKPLESTYVVIEEVDLDNWGWGGLPTAQYRRQRMSTTNS